MNSKNAHPFTESAEGNAVHSHHGVLWVLALHHPAHLGQAASRGPPDPRNGTHFCCKSLGGFVSPKSGKRSLLTEQMPSSGSFICSTDLRNQSIPLHWKQETVINWLSGCFGCMGHLLATAKRTSLLRAFPSQTGCVRTDQKFVFTCFQLLSCGD